MDLTYLVEERLDLLLPLAFTDLIDIGHFEELRRHLDEPLGLDRHHVVTVLARCKNQLVVYAPLRISVEQR